MPLCVSNGWTLSHLSTKTGRSEYNGSWNLCKESTLLLFPWIYGVDLVGICRNFQATVCVVVLYGFKQSQDSIAVQMVVMPLPYALPW